VIDTAEFERRFGGLRRLYGVEGAQRLFEAHVVVVGIGGVGSWTCEALARSGVARLTLIDMDHVGESNINRQIHALSHTLGQSKGLAMRDRIHAFHPGCQVDVIDDFVTAENWPLLVQQIDPNARGFDIVKAFRHGGGSRGEALGPCRGFGRLGRHHPRPAPGQRAVPAAQSARCDPHWAHGRGLRVQPRIRGTSRFLLCLGRR